MGGIFNQGIYHGIEAGDDGQAYERYGNPPTELTVPKDGDNGLSATGFKPGTHITVRRFTKDDGTIIYPGAYFFEGLAANGTDVIIWVWNGTGWSGPYGG